MARIMPSVLPIVLWQNDGCNNALSFEGVALDIFQPNLIYIYIYIYKVWLKYLLLLVAMGVRGHGYLTKPPAWSRLRLAIRVRHAPWLNWQRMLLRRVYGKLYIHYKVLVFHCAIQCTRYKLVLTVHSWNKKLTKYFDLDIFARSLSSLLMDWTLPVSLKMSTSQRTLNTVQKYSKLIDLVIRIYLTLAILLPRFSNFLRNFIIHFRMYLCLVTCFLRVAVSLFHNVKQFRLPSLLDRDKL